MSLRRGRLCELPVLQGKTVVENDVPLGAGGGGDTTAFTRD